MTTPLPRASTPENPLRAAGVELETLAIDGDTYNGAGMVRAEVGLYRDEHGPDAEVIVLVRGSHRFFWHQAVPESLQPSPASGAGSGRSGRPGSAPEPRPGGCSRCTEC